MRDTIWLSSRGLGRAAQGSSGQLRTAQDSSGQLRAAQGSYGINMRQEYFPNKPIQREREFGVQ